MLIPLFSEYRYMYPLEPEYEYVPKEAVLLAAIVPSFFPLESATIKLRVELPLLLNTTLIVSEPDTGTLTERYDVVPVPERARQYVYAVPSTVTDSALTFIVLLLVAIRPSPSTVVLALIVPNFLKFHEFCVAALADNTGAAVKHTNNTATTAAKTLLAFLIMINLPNIID